MAGARERGSQLDRGASAMSDEEPTVAAAHHTQSRCTRSGVETPALSRPVNSHFDIAMARELPHVDLDDVLPICSSDGTGIRSAMREPCALAGHFHPRNKTEASASTGSHLLLTRLTAAGWRRRRHEVGAATLRDSQK
jgi:hypothetical protein